MAIYRVQRQFGLALDVSNIPGVPESMKSPTVAGAGSGASTVASNATIPFKPAATGTNVENLKNTKEVFKNGQNSVGLKQGALNTWNKMGKMGKAGVIGAGVLGAGLMAKGLMGGGGSREAAFSEDTSAALQEAAIYGTVGAGTLGAVALAKRGKLGFTKAQRANNKEAYQKVVRKVKSVWAEQGNKAKEVTQETRTVKNPGKPAETTTRTTINKVTINKSDWPKVRAYMEANGMDLRDPSAKLKAAKAVGVTPSVK